MKRIREGDILYRMFDELCRDAMTVKLYDGDGRETWKTHCLQLLAACPDLAQRLAWQMTLAQALSAGTGLPVSVSMAYLRGEFAFNQNGGAI